MSIKTFTPEKNQIFEKFQKEYLEGMSKSTIKNYRLSYDTFLSYLERNGADIDNFGIYDVVSFYEELLEKYKPSYANLIMRKLKKIFPKHKAFQKIKLVVEPIQKPQSLSDAERRRLLRMAETFSRNMKLAVYLGLLAGLRLMEISNLRWNDVDLQRKKLRIRGKMGRIREIPIHPVLLEALREIPEDERKEYVLVAERGPKIGRKVSRNGVWRLIRYAGNEAGIENLHPHTLRHTFAKTLLDNGAKLTEVAYLLGHYKNDGSVSLTTVTRYTTPGNEELLEIVKKI